MLVAEESSKKMQEIFSERGSNDFSGEGQVSPMAGKPYASVVVDVIAHDAANQSFVMPYFSRNFPVLTMARVIVPRPISC